MSVTIRIYINHISRLIEHRDISRFNRTSTVLSSVRLADYATKLVLNVITLCNVNLQRSTVLLLLAEIRGKREKERGGERERETHIAIINTKSKVIN